METRSRTVIKLTLNDLQKTLRGNPSCTCVEGMERLLGTRSSEKNGRTKSEEKGFVIQKHGFRFRRFGAIELHLNQEAPNIRPEYGMDRVLFAGKNLLDRAHLPAYHHVQVAVINRAADGRAALIVVRDEREVDGAASGYAEVVGRLLRRCQGLSQAGNLFRLFIDLLLRYADRNVKLGNF